MDLSNTGAKSRNKTLWEDLTMHMCFKLHNYSSLKLGVESVSTRTLRWIRVSKVLSIINFDKQPKPPI